MKHEKIRTICPLALTLLLAGTGLVGIVRAGDKSESKDIVAVASDAGNFKTLVAAIKAAGLVATLQGTGPFTVFAPTDKAFAKLPAGTVDGLLKPENREKLVAILTYRRARCRRGCR